ncbi:SPOR domain-containing protein [Melioribacteraceae bacterium 4301-Me]|uniref:SPOR domain-containing protein n=1 Tax=Pyranulibacter aquaticus TaxID=3163344 RepID=UPI00359B43A4
MTKKDLQNKIASLIGVSSSEKELAYEVFIDKVVESLTPGMTIKVSNIGFFQLKQEKQSLDENYSELSIVYSPYPSDIDKDDKTFYLILDVKAKKKNFSEFDSNVFSIGVGKPLIPLYEKNNFSAESETSFVLLKKTIEEKVNQIISESDVLENFNIWDDYIANIESSENSVHSEELNLQNTLNELTEDINFDDSEENLNKIINSDEIKLEFEKEEKEGESNKVEQDISIDFGEKIESIDAEKDDDEFDADFNLIHDELKFSESHENNFNSKLDIDSLVQDDAYLSTDEKQREGLEGENFSFTSIKSDKENVDWNWGDELKEEFGLGDNDNSETTLNVNDDKVRENDIFLEGSELDNNKNVDLFAQLDNEIKQEKEEQFESDEEIMEVYSHSADYEFVTDKNFQQEQRISSHFTDEISKIVVGENKVNSKNIEDEEEKYFTRNFILIFSGFVIIASIIIYLFIIPNSSSSKRSKTENAASIQTEQIPDKSQSAFKVSKTPEENVNGSVENISGLKPTVNANSRIESDKYKSSSGKKTGTDIRVSNLIFFDGSKYNVQISSWRNIVKAQQEVSKLKKSGLNAFVIEANLPDKGGMWYRVRVGGFNSKEEAENFLNNKTKK